MTSNPANVLGSMNRNGRLRTSPIVPDFIDYLQYRGAEGVESKT